MRCRHAPADTRTHGCPGNPGVRDASAYWEPDPAHQAASVWLVAMRDAKSQRRGRYLRESARHPAKMLPDLARHAIVHYTRPEELVLDPMCGIGTTLIEALHAGRHAVGVELEPRWAQLARANIELARLQGATGRGTVRIGDARRLADRPLAPPSTCGRTGGARPVALLLTSPPYGQHTHGHGYTRPGSVIKTHFRYSPTRRGSTNLAHQDVDRLLVGFTDILTAAVSHLRPGGHAVITARPYRRDGELVDFPSGVITAAETAGLTLIDRGVAPLAGIRNGHLVHRAAFFPRLHAADARAAGVPQQVPLHEDILIFRYLPSCLSSRELKCSQRELEGAQRSSCHVGTRVSAEPERVS